MSARYAKDSRSHSFPSVYDVYSCRTVVANILNGVHGENKIAHSFSVQSLCTVANIDCIQITAEAILDFFCKQIK